jgi:hypothetical protein
MKKDDKSKSQAISMPESYWKIVDRKVNAKHSRSKIVQIAIELAYGVKK